MKKINFKQINLIFLGLATTLAMTNIYANSESTIEITEQEKLEQIHKLTTFDNNRVCDGKRTSSSTKNTSIQPHNVSVSSSSYIRAINAKIINYFIAPDNIVNMAVTVKVFVDRTGNVEQLIITKKSKSRELDRAAINAVRSASPLPINPNDPNLYPCFEFPFVSNR